MPVLWPSPYWLWKLSQSYSLIKPTNSSVLHVICDIMPLSVLFKFAMQLIETLLDANQKFQP